MRYDRGNTPQYWDDYWSKSKSRTETYARRSALEYVAKLKPESVLDVGCGTGKTLAEIKHECFRFGVDISSTAIKKMIGLRGIEGMVASAYDVDTIPYTFDFIIANHLLEHLDNDEEFLQKCKTILEPNGTIFIGVPNHVSTPEETDKHCQCYSKESLKELMEKVFNNVFIFHVGNHLFAVSKNENL